MNERRLRAAIGAGMFGTTAVAFLRAPLLPDMGRDLELSALGLGALSSVFALGRLAADFPAGRLTERARPGMMMAVAAASAGGGSVAMGLAPTAVLAFVAAFLLGVGSSWTMTTSMAVFAGAPRQRRGVSMSIFSGALLAGQSLGPTAGGFLAAAWDWRVALVAGGVASALIALPFVRYPGPAPSRTIQDPGGEPQASPGRGILITLYLLPAVQFSIGAAAVQTILPIAGGDELGLGAAVIGLALGVGGLARFVGAVAAGWIADRHGRKWALIPGLGIQLGGLLVMALGVGIWAWWAAILGLTLGSVAVNIGSTMLADLHEGQGMGHRLGAFRFTGDLAFMVTPLIAGALYEVQGRALSTVPMLLLTGGVLLASIIVLPETLRGGADQSTPAH